MFIKKRPLQNNVHNQLIIFRSSFSDFAQKFGKDDRFKGIEKMRDRESLFNEFILEVRRREKDEKIQKKETVSMQNDLKNFLYYLYCDFFCFQTTHYY